LLLCANGYTIIR
jgi:predicted XRE-type DNA-binding protein